MFKAPVIMLIRHAEKASPELGGVHETGEDDQHSLSVGGWQRAGALVPFFAPSLNRAMPDTRLARPAFLFAEAADAPGSEPKKSKREEQTLSALAEMLGVEPNFSFGRGQEAEIAQAARQCPGPVLIAWEHHNLFALAHEIAGAHQYPAEWPKERYDLVLLFRLQADGVTYTFEQIPQMLLAGDLEALLEG